jgi:hypothetical protein
MKKAEAENTASVRLDYLMAASYYWFKAVGNDEQLVSALYRAKAEKLKLQLGAHLPTPEEVRAFAVERWPAHRLHNEAV